MEETKRSYKIVEDGRVIAEFYTFDNAVIFLGAYYSKYYKEPVMDVRLIRTIQTGTIREGVDICEDA